MVIVIITILSRRRKESDRERQIKNAKDDEGDIYDDKRHFKYDFRKAAEDYSARHMKENDIDEEFADADVVNNPMYNPEGAVFDNPTYLVSQLSSINSFLLQFLQDPN